MAIWKEHRTVRLQQTHWECTQAKLDLLDKRVMQLAGCTSTSVDFVRKGLRPWNWKWTGLRKRADLSKIIEDSPGDYIFTKSLPAAADAPVGHLLLRILKSASCDYSDANARANLASLKEKVTLLVC